MRPAPDPWQHGPTLVAPRHGNGWHARRSVASRDSSHSCKRQRRQTSNRIRAANAAEVAAVLADDGVVAAFGAAFGGADLDDAGGTGPQRQHVLGIVGDDAYILHDDAVLVENSEQGEAVDD